MDSIYRSKPIKFLLFLIIYLFVSFTVHAETLLELYKLAEQYDPQLKISNTNRLIVLEKKPQAEALLRPQVNLSAEVNEAWRFKDWMMGNSIENTSAGYNLSLSYGLYRPTSEIILDQAESQIKEAQVSYEAARQELMMRVANRYFAVLAANDNLKRAQLAKEAFKKQLDQAQQRFDVGLIAITDVQEAKAGYDSSVAEEIRAKNELDNTREALHEITGVYHEILAGLSDDAPLLDPEPSNIEVWTKRALEQNPNLLAVHYSIDVARQEIDKQRAALLPTVDVVGVHGYNEVLRGEKVPGSLSTTNGIGVQMNYPLYEGGATRSRIREAQQRYTQSIELLEQQRRSVERQTHDAFLNIMSDISRIQALKQAVVSNQTALEAIKTGFEVGTRTTVDVLLAQSKLLDAQRDYSNARYNYVLNTLRLKQAVGTLSVEDLNSINEWLTLHKIEIENEDSPPSRYQGKPIVQDFDQNKDDQLKVDEEELRTSKDSEKKTYSEEKPVQTSTESEQEPSSPRPSKENKTKKKKRHSK